MAEILTPIARHPHKSQTDLFLLDTANMISFRYKCLRDGYHKKKTTKLQLSVLLGHMQGPRLGAVGSKKGQRTSLHVQRINTVGLVLRQDLDCSVLQAKELA